MPYYDPFHQLKFVCEEKNIEYLKIKIKTLDNINLIKKVFYNIIISSFNPYFPRLMEYNNSIYPTVFKNLELSGSLSSDSLNPEESCENNCNGAWMLL